jgi:cell division protein FtsW
MKKQGTKWVGWQKFLPQIFLFLVVTALSFLGLIILFSATHAHHSDPYYFIRRQSLWLVLAILVCSMVTFVFNLEKLRKFILVIGIGSLVLLILVLIPGIGIKINGARRWINLGLMNMQVSDFAKIGMIFVLAHVLSINQRYLKSFSRGFCLPCAVIGIVFVLTALQPDYGTAFLIGMVGVILLFLAGIRLLYLLPTVFLGISALAVAIFYNPERMERITSFLDIEENRADGAYQLWQGILGFGVGGVRGVGLGNGRQQMAFLPESHTDFIFPVIGEELGLLFTAAVVMAFLFIFFLGFWNLRRAPNLFQYILVAGSVLLIVFQALINLCVTTGLLPTKGMSLPFISYGGSNLVCMFILVGVILNCFRFWNRPPLNPSIDL